MKEPIIKKNIIMKKNLLVLFLFVCSINSFAQTLANQNVILSSLGTPPLHYSYIKGVPLPTGGFALLYNEYISGLEADYILVKIDATGNMVATTSYNGLHNSKDFGTNICATDSFVYAVGFTMDSSGTNSRTFNCLKINIATWDTIWTHGENIDSGVAELATTVLADDSGNVYVGGTVQTATDNHMTLIKYAPDGTKLWTTHYSGTYAYVSPVSMSFSGRFINVTGYSFDGIGHSNTVTAGFDKYTGSFWGDKVESGGIGIISHPVNIAVDQQANSYISGSSTVSGTNSVIKTVSYDASFNPLWVSTWGDSSLTNTASGMVVDLMGLNENIFISGSTVNSSGQHSMVVLRYTMDGTLKWARILTASNPAFPTDGVGITTDGIGNCYATGTQYNGIDTDIVTVAYDSTGTVLWKKIYNSATGVDDVPFSILMGGSESNSVIVSARSGGSSPDYKAIEYDQRQAVPCGDTICPTITYSFGTGTVTTAGIDTFIEFDIYAKQNEPSLAYYGGNIIFTYGKDVFGNSIVDSNHIIITRGTIISDTNYMYSLKDTIYKSDALPPNGGEVLLSIAPHSSSGLYAIADTFQQLCHVKIKRKNRGSLGIGFDQFYMQNKSFFADGAYSYVDISGRVTNPLSNNDSIYYMLEFDTLYNDFTSSAGIYPKTFVFYIKAFGNSGQSLYDGDPVITYNTNTFGSNIASEGTIICNSQTSSAYDPVLVGDVLQNVIQVHLNADINNYDLLYEPDSTIGIGVYPQILATCALKVKNCCSPIQLSVNRTSTGYYGYLDLIDSSSIPKPYSVGLGSGIDTTVSCDVTAPSITSFYPASITAGTFDTLTIVGIGFGCNPGRVYFTNANVSVSSFVSTQTPDIISWHDNEIKVIVASCQNYYDDDYTPGTGPIYISSNQASPLSSPLVISYAVMNDRLSSLKACRVGLSGSNNKYTFSPDTTIVSNYPALETITHAMNDWVCETGVHFVMGATVDSNLTEAPDGKSVIYFGNLSNPDAYAFCRTWKSVPKVNNVGDTVEVISDEDYIFDQTILNQFLTYPWFLGNTSTIPDTIQPNLGYISLLAVARHEFGHGMGLRHTLNTSDLMYYATDVGVCKSIHTDDQLGGLYELVSVKPYITSCFIENPQNYPTNCPGGSLNGLENLSDQNKIVAYPNPFDQTITIATTIERETKVSISILNLLGQKVVSYDFGKVSDPFFEGTVKTERFDAGIYIVEVLLNNNSHVLKLVKN